MSHLYTRGVIVLHADGTSFNSVRTRVREGDTEVAISQICLTDEVGDNMASGMWEVPDT